MKDIISLLIGLLSILVGISMIAKALKMQKKDSDNQRVNRINKNK